MHIATLITLTLVVILILSLRLLFSFSYNTFIPWEMSFGIYLYLTFLIILYLGRETYFFKAKYSHNKKFIYAVIPVIANIVIAIIILYNFPLSSSYNGIGEGGLGEFYGALIIYSSLLACLIGITVLLVNSGHRRYEAVYDNPITHVIPPNDEVIKKTAVFTIPTLIALISIVLFLAYSDYSTAGLKHNYTSKSNISVMYKKAKENQDITFCDRIINVRNADWIRERCYENYLEDVKEIEQISSGSPESFKKLDFFSLYSHLKLQQCNKTIKPDICEILLINKTYELLEFKARELIKHANFRITTDRRYIRPVITLTVKHKYRYAIVHDSIVSEIKKLAPNPVISTNRYLPEKKNDSSTEITTVINLDIKKIATSKPFLLEIDNIIQSKKTAIKALEVKWEKKQKIQRDKRRQKYESVKQKYKNDMRKKYHLKPNDQVKRCVEIKHYYDKCECLVPMCVNNVFVYDSLYENDRFYTPARALCFRNIQQGKKPCEGISPIYPSDIRLRR